MAAILTVKTTQSIVAPPSEPLPETRQFSQNRLTPYGPFQQFGVNWSETVERLGIEGGFRFKNGGVPRRWWGHAGIGRPDAVKSPATRSH
jgi:hypothetical protein